MRFSPSKRLWWCLVAGIWLAGFPPKVLRFSPSQWQASPSRNIGRIALAVLLTLGFHWYPLYMGRILVWVVPVLAAQWEFGAEALLAHMRPARTSGDCDCVEYAAFVSARCVGHRRRHLGDRTCAHADEPVPDRGAAAGRSQCFNMANKKYLWFKL